MQFALNPSHLLNDLFCLQAPSSSSLIQSLLPAGLNFSLHRYCLVIVGPILFGYYSSHPKFFVSSYFRSPYPFLFLSTPHALFFSLLPLDRQSIFHGCVCGSLNFFSKSPLCFCSSPQPCAVFLFLFCLTHLRVHVQ